MHASCATSIPCTSSERATSMAGDAPLRFSVLVPTRDRAELAESCVRTVLAQRGAPPFEMLVIDQSRDEATRAAVERAAAAAGAALDREVVHVPQRAAGRSRALNAGWPLARGEWVVIIDD